MAPVLQNTPTGSPAAMVADDRQGVKISDRRAPGPGSWGCRQPGGSLLGVWRKQGGPVSSLSRECENGGRGRPSGGLTVAGPVA